MRFFDLLTLILDNLGRRKGRVVMTAIGVVIGTAAVVLLVSLGVGLQQNAHQQLVSIGDLTLITVYPGYEEDFLRSGGGGGDPNQPQLLTPKALADIRDLPNVVQIIPRDYLQGTYTLKFGKLDTWANMMGMEIDSLEIFQYPLREGTDKLERGTAIIGGWAAKNFADYTLRPGQEPPPQPELLGQQLRLVLLKWDQDGNEIKKTVTLRVVGVLAEVRGEQDSSLYVRMEDLVSWNEWFQGGSASTAINAATTTWWSR